MAKATFVCPECKASYKMDIPKDVCVGFTFCKACGKRILAKKGDCCVICSYSDKKCPVHKEGH
ncbi:MAG: hypothetical protein HYT16_01605 [DPANN group archaeon]|nr:hypothetical protein [DPANN group archaeon]